MIKIIKKSTYEMLLDYQEEWIKANTRANSLEMICLRQKDELEAAYDEIKTLKLAVNVQTDEINALKAEKHTAEAVETSGDDTTIAESIKSYRKAHKLTQKQLGDMLGVSSHTVRKWEGGRVPSIENLNKLKALMEGK